MNLFQELKRRKVFKTLGVYAAAALIIIQVADIVFPRLLLPNWTVTFVIVLIIIGFPITFFLSWNYDIKPDSKLDPGKINPEEITHPEANQTEKSNTNIYSITGAVLACLGIGFWFFFSTSSLSIADEGLIENSIAVFGFENLSEVDKSSRMGEILQHLIISDLSGLTHLKVISHQRLKDIQKQNSEDVENYTIAQQANAKVLLSGSIMDLSGKKILVGELIDALDGNVIISHRIEGEDIYSMVDELTDNIHKNLDISKHSNDDIELQAGTKTTQSLDAYEKYLEGLNYLSKLDFESANNRFQDAIKIDSSFFDAHYLSAIAMWWMDESETNQEASEYCKQLIDNKIYNDDIQKLEAEGAYNIIRGNYKEALPIYEKIIKLKPDEKTSWYMYGEANYHIEKSDDEEGDKYWDAADKAFKKALDLDPSFGIAKTHIIHMLLHAQNFSEVIKEVTEDFKYNKNNWEAYYNIIIAYELLDDSTNAAKYLENAKSSLGPGKFCNVNIQTGWSLAFTRQKLNFHNQTNYHLRRAVYYLKNALAVCSDDKIHPTKNNRPHIDPLPVILSYRAYDSEYAENLYEEITGGRSDSEKMKFAHRVGKYNMWEDIRKQFPNEEISYQLSFSKKYLSKALKYSKELNNKKYFTNTLTLIMGYYSQLDLPEKAESFFKQELIDFCGSEIIEGCISPNRRTLDLAEAFYKLGNYDLSMKIHLFMLKSINLLQLRQNESNSEDAEYLISQLPFHKYRLGLMNMKKGQYSEARSYFENTAVVEDERSWLTKRLLNKKIGDCYYKEKKYNNAISYFNASYQSYLDDDDSLGAIESLNRQALSEYHNNQKESAITHFKLAEKYLETIENINYEYGASYYYNEWSLYQYYYTEGNTKKALQYLTDAYNNISEKERTAYLEDNNREKWMNSRYFYIHEIIDTYNRQIR